MTDNAQINVYTLENCPNCELLKDFLDGAGAKYTVRDMMSAEALTELRINGVFVREAPVLQVGKTFLTSKDLFDAKGVIEDVVGPLCKGD
ncbi:NrdH-redoxin [Methanomicrobiaceae archaeon CYW5]|uniref:glutaredoxin family protein n=1 Tax=Methanovulcanius yangii TaxID=1789227 RepID=UPI0029CA043F|nr:glutaredoxin domain-containing protein [Methanovulcanius yangii]MBT8507217.1 NrdH-redoxin [Methanovulcanius yangii]